MNTVERPWVRTIARTGPRRRERSALPTAANPIVTFARPRSGPLYVSGTPYFRNSHVGTGGMMNPAPSPIRAFSAENFRSGLSPLRAAASDAGVGVGRFPAYRRSIARGDRREANATAIIAYRWTSTELNPVADRMAGKNTGSEKPRPSATCATMKDRENAASRFSTVVWSAMAAFHEERNAPSAIPARMAATRRTGTLAVTPNTRRMGVRRNRPARRTGFLPTRSARMPSGIAPKTSEAPSDPRMRPTEPAEIPSSGRNPAITTRRYPYPTADGMMQRMNHRTFGSMRENPSPFRLGAGADAFVPGAISVPVMNVTLSTLRTSLRNGIDYRNRRVRYINGFLPWHRHGRGRCRHNHRHRGGGDRPRLPRRHGHEDPPGRGGGRDPAGPREVPDERRRDVRPRGGGPPPRRRGVPDPHWDGRGDLAREGRPPGGERGRCCARGRVAADAGDRQG